MLKRKFRPVMGVIKKDVVIIGVGYSSGNKTFVISLLNLFIGVEITKKRKR